ncbi:MAG: hypothetical protein ACR2LU_08115, partial [Luteitalea sp.]
MPDASPSSVARPTSVALLGSALALCALGLGAVVARAAGVPAGPLGLRLSPLAVCMMTPAIASILAGWYGRTRLARRLSLLALGAATGTLLVQFAIDLLPRLVAPLVSSESLPARQATLSVLATAALGLPLTRGSRHAERVKVLQVWGSLLLAFLATTSLVTWAASGASETWLRYLLMSPQLAVCCLRVAAALLTDRVRRGETAWQRWLPATISVFLGACALIFAQALSSQESAGVRRQAEAEAIRLQDTLSERIATMESGLGRMRARYESGSVASRAEWEADGNEYVKSYGGVLTSMTVSEVGGKVLWVVPATLAGHIRGHDASRTPERTGAIGRAVRTREV